MSLSSSRTRADAFALQQAKMEKARRSPPSPLPDVLVVRASQAVAHNAASKTKAPANGRGSNWCGVAESNRPAASSLGPLGSFSRYVACPWHSIVSMAPQRRQSVQSSFKCSCHEFIHVASQVRSNDSSQVDAEPRNEEPRYDIPERDTQSHEGRTLKLIK